MRGLVARGIRQPVNHDLAAWVDAMRTRSFSIRVVRVGHVDRQEVVAVDVAPVEQVASFRRPEVALSHLSPRGHEAERYIDALEDTARLEQIELSFGFDDEDGIRDAGEPGLANWTIYLDLNNNGQLDRNEFDEPTEPTTVTAFDDPATEIVNVVGPICESGDQLGVDRLLPPSEEGDILLIATAGAYGRAMSSRYNLRDPAPEFMI